jgi:hypothetical protein
MPQGVLGGRLRRDRFCQRGLFFVSAVVIAAVFGFAFYFFIVDAIIGRGVTKLFDTFTK